MALFKAALYALTMVVFGVLLLPIWIPSFVVGFLSRAAYAAWTHGYVLMDEWQEAVKDYLEEYRNGDDT